jgi:WD40 repeat protein
VPNRKLVRSFDGFERAITRVAFDPKGDLVAAGTGDGQVWVWSAATGRRTQVLDTGTRGVRALAFSADGKLLVTATNKAPVAVWDVAPAPANGTAPDA